MPLGSNLVVCWAATRPRGERRPKVQEYPTKGLGPENRDHSLVLEDRTSGGVKWSSDLRTETLALEDRISGGVKWSSDLKTEKGRGSLKTASS